MAIGLPETSDKVAATLREIVAEHGPEVLSRPLMISNLLADLLPESPQVSRILVAAAQDRISESLRGYVGQGVDAATAIKLVASSFAAATLFTPEACTWVVRELAVSSSATIPRSFGRRSSPWPPWSSP